MLAGQSNGMSMDEYKTLTYIIKDPLELNLSYMSFINNGGLFIPTMDTFKLGDAIQIDLHLPTKNDSIKIEGRVAWITPKNSLHHVLPGIGIQFTSENAQTIRSQIEALLDPKVEIGGYTYGITEETKRDK